MDCRWNTVILSLGQLWGNQDNHFIDAFSELFKKYNYPLSKIQLVSALILDSCWYGTIDDFYRGQIVDDGDKKAIQIFKERIESQLIGPFNREQLHFDDREFYNAWVSSIRLCQEISSNLQKIEAVAKKAHVIIVAVIDPVRFALLKNTHKSFFENPQITTVTSFEEKSSNLVELAHRGLQRTDGYKRAFSFHPDIDQEGVERIFGRGDWDITLCVTGGLKGSLDLLRCLDPR